MKNEKVFCSECEYAFLIGMTATGEKKLECRAGIPDSDHRGYASWPLMLDDRRGYYFCYRGCEKGKEIL